MRMILFIRDAHNNTIVDVEVYETEGHIELHSTVDVRYYSELLLRVLRDEKDRVAAMVGEFVQIQELRGWLWEEHFMGRQNESTEFDVVLQYLRSLLKSIAYAYNLYYVED
jgi:hypothetical protein